MVRLCDKLDIHRLSYYRALQALQVAEGRILQTCKPFCDQSIYLSHMAEDVIYVELTVVYSQFTHRIGPRHMEEVVLNTQGHGKHAEI
jgi:hypothetical protein